MYKIFETLQVLSPYLSRDATSDLQIFGERYDVHNNVAYIMIKL